MDFCRISDLLNEIDEEYIEGMRAYIRRLKALPAEEAKMEAEAALLRTGVIDNNGNLKENIVSI